MNRFYRALESKYQAKIEEALAVLDLYLTKAVGVGEHSDILEILDTQIGVIEKYNSRLQTLRTILPQSSESDSHTKANN